MANRISLGHVEVRLIPTMVNEHVLAHLPVNAPITVEKVKSETSERIFYKATVEGQLPITLQAYQVEEISE